VNHQIYGNANLKAEQSDTWNFSADYRIQNEMNVHDITAKLYYNDIKNLVDFAFIGNDKYSYVNIGNYKSVGGEISTNYYSANINTQLGFSYIGRYNHLSESYDTPEFTYSPEFQGNILWKLPFYRNLQLGLFYKYTGKMPGYGLTTNEELVLYTMNDYSIMDLTATLNMFDNNISLQIGAKNLFDVKQIQQSIATVQGAHSTGAVMMPVGWGRTIFATLKVNFNKMWDK
jgi:outer membrane receptor for ferrienterochelin and colicins